MSTVAVSQSHTVNTNIIITTTTPYCGGANPPEHILEEARKKKIPFGEKFYIINGCKNSVNRKIIDTLTIDSLGICSLKLKPGCYSVINNFGLNTIKVDTSQYDIKCLKLLWVKPLFSFKVIKGKNDNFSFNISESCPYNKPCFKGHVALPM